jgi:hypothetical protein
VPLPALALAWPLGAAVKAWCSSCRRPQGPDGPLWICDQPAGHVGDHTDRDEGTSWPRPLDPAALTVTVGDVIRIRSVQ